VGLLNKAVTAGSRNDFLVLHTVEHRDFPHSSSVAAQFIGMNDFRDLKFDQQSMEEPSSLRIPMFLHQHVQHSTVFVYGPPQPVLDPADVNTHFVQVPP